jgi:hypothetical protein
MLAGFAIATLTGFAVLASDVVGLLLLLTIIPVFLVWLYHASRNAEDSGYPQRWSPGWAIGGWFVPVIFLWFPYQIVSDIWRAGQPPERRARTPWPVVAWWTCWLLAWVTGFQYTHTARSVHIGVDLYSTNGSRLVLAIAAILLILVVRNVSTGSGTGRPERDGGNRVYPVACPRYHIKQVNVDDVCHPLWILERLNRQGGPARVIRVSRARPDLGM